MTDQPMVPAAILETPARPLSARGQSGGRFGGGSGWRAWLQPATFIGLCMLAVVYGVLALLIVNDRREALANATRTTDNLVRIVDQSYSHIFRSVDATLQLLRRAYQQSKSADELQAWLNDKAAQTELEYRFVILDKNGDAVAASNGIGAGLGMLPAGQNFGDREYFLRQKDTPTDELFFSAPIQGKLTNRATIVVTRRLVAEDGTFAGVVAAVVTPDSLIQVGADLDLGTNGAFGLIGMDGIVRARAVNGKAANDPQPTTRLGPSSTLFSHVINARNGHFFSQFKSFDQHTRLVAYRVIGDFPLIATVSVTEDFIYRHANRQAQIYWMIALLVTAAILLGIRWGIAREEKLLAAEDDRRRSQERYRLVEEAVNDGIWDWNIECGYNYKSPHWKRLMGVAANAPPTDLQAFHALVHPDDRAAVKEALRAHLEDGAPYAVEFRVRHAKGHYIWVQSRGMAQRDADGKAVRMVGTLSDITERMEAEASLKESRDNLARAERLALLGHFKNNLLTRTITWSDGIYAMFGFTPDYSPTVRGFYEMVLPEDQLALKNAGNDVIAGREIPNLVIRARRPDGAIVDLDIWMTPVRDGDGAITGIFGTIQDVTMRRRTEELLARANQELEARVSARTAELAQEMRRREEAQMTLGQMQKMEAVGQLTAGVAHDFNNLLSVIAGSLEFVDRAAARGLTADPDLVDAAMRATRRGRELVRRLLAFSRQTPLRAEPTPIDQMVLDTLRLLQRTLGTNIDLVTRLNAKDAVISVDRNQLANALLNLAINARDSMPEGGQITIATECRPCDPALAKSSRWPTGEEVCITVSDTGFGMTEDVLARAAEPFFTTKADGLGSGLGLSMVQGFTEQSGGQLRIESKPQRGTSVTIKLPRIASACPPDEADNAAAGADAQSEKIVLLVEDDADVRIVAGAQLRHLGFKVHAVANGMEALDLIVSPATIDILLTDVVLPGGLDGISLIKEAITARPGMGIVCMSGYDPAQKHRKWLSQQNIAFLEKPFNTQKLGQALEMAVAD
ncbi:MAG TPA: PAS domain-containing protein [Pseudolabrys sp.]|nr:PAS domain-containing protein [Pseudolabrys sp.]